jgi:hypothetical protein
LIDQMLPPGTRQVGMPVTRRRFWGCEPTSMVALSGLAEAWASERAFVGA